MQNNMNKYVLFFSFSSRQIQLGVNQGWQTMNHIPGNDASFDNDCQIIQKQFY